MAKWLYSGIEHPTFRICDKCGRAYKVREEEGSYNYCPNCGAEMREVQNGN